ncbi:MAG: response regulator [Desulfobacterium sp.]|nr:response regulator [Desulfobacterium sp.]MBU3949879.1 chemotaxis protein CheW [Pseudomonadota bacterium]MBU4035472.1 chemotaxis protein CheW [Pseudomonadota bacterium]
MAVDPKIKILLVEDAATMRKMEVKILKQLSFENILEAVDGDDAIHKIESEKNIQLIISDWAMPNKDGYELLRWLREHESYNNIPMIMATGQGDKEYVEKAIQGGANGVVAKPFTPEDLKAQIDKAFGIDQKKPKKADSGIKVDKEGKVLLKIAHIQITDHLTLGVMKHMLETGKKNADHFKLETLCMPGWNPVQAALENDDVDAAFILAPIAMDLFNYGIPIKLVMFAHRNGSIFVRSKSKNYRKPYQQFFKHKTFFIPHKMSVHNMLSHIYFTQMGLKPGIPGKEAVNVLFDVVPPVKMPEFLGENPESCGFMVAEPIGSRAISAGIAEKQFVSSEIWENHPCCVAVFRNEFIDKHPDAVQEFCNILTEAGRFIGENPDEASKIAVSFLDPEGQLGLQQHLLRSVLTDPKGIKTDNLYPVVEDLETIQTYMTNNMNIGRMIDLNAFVDKRFADISYKDAPDSIRSASPVKQIKSVNESSDAGNEPGKIKGKTQTAVDINVRASREGKYLSFGISDEKYGLGILDVREIIGMIPIRPMLQMPEFIKGVVNLRGKIIPVIDMRLKFGMEPLDYNDRTCIIVVEVSGLSGSTLMGLVVDTVWEVSDIKEEETEDCPHFGSSINTNYILGIAKTKEGITMLLDIDKILQVDDVVQLAEVA